MQYSREKKPKLSHLSIAILCTVISSCDICMPKRNEIHETPYGLCSDPDVLKAPQGALGEVDNCIINRDGIIEARYGADAVSLSGTTLDSVDVMHNFDGDILLIDKDTPAMEFLGNKGNPLLDEDSSDPEFFPSYYTVQEARGNLYVPCQDGVRKVTTSDSTDLFEAGLTYYAYVTSITNAAASYPQWWASNYYVKYRITIQKTDANDLVVESPPSYAYAEQNVLGSASSAFVRIVFSVDHLVAGDIVRVFRTRTGTSLAALGDSFYLSVNHTLTAAEVVAGYFEFADVKSDDELEESLYTNPENEGINQANMRPPAAKDISSYKKSLFYSNVIEPSRIILGMANSYSDLVGVATGAGVRVVNGTTTNGSPNLTGLADTTGLEVGQLVKGSGIPSKTFVISVGAGGAGTASLNKNATASATVDLDFVDVITLGYGSTYYTVVGWVTGVNRYAAKMISEMISDGFTESVNIDFTANLLDEAVVAQSAYNNMLIERRGLNTSTFYVWGTHGESYDPPLTGPTYSGGFVFSTNTGVESDMLVKPNRQYWSKSDQPEHVPLTNWHDIGDNSAIIRSVETKDGLIVFKNDGIYTVTGEGAYSGFTVRTLDKNTILTNPLAAVHAEGYVYAFTNQGLVRVSIYGVEKVSSPYVDSEILPDWSLASIAQYIIYQRKLGTKITVPSIIHDKRDGNIILLLRGYSTCYIVLVYNLKTRVFTTWTPGDYILSALSVDYDQLYGGYGTLYFGGRYCADYNASGTPVKLWKNNSSRGSDYERYKTVASKPDSTTINFTTAHYAVAGNYIVDGSEQQEILTVVDSDTVTVADNSNISGTCSIYTPIESTIKWLPKFGETRAFRKNFVAYGIVFRVAPGEYSIVLVDGGSTYGPYTITKTTERRNVPVAAARKFFLEPSVTIVDLVNDWQLVGLSLEYYLQAPRGV